MKPTPETPEQVAERLLPCHDLDCRSCDCPKGRHDHHCPAELRPTVAAAIREEREAHETIRKNAAIIIEGFNKRIFVRNIKGDRDPSWAIRIVPYVVALGRLAKALSGSEEVKGDE